MNRLGMPFFGCQTPNGYDWTAAPWVNTGDLLNRMNLALALAANRMGQQQDLDALIGIASPDAIPAAEKEARLEKILLNGEASEQTRLAVLKDPEATRPSGDAQAGAGLRRPAAFAQSAGGHALPPPEDKQAAAIAGLLMGSPDFQHR